MSSSRIARLSDLGQSVWLDDIRRDLISAGQLDRLIRDDGLRGLTSNPTIFERAIAETDLYDERIRDLALGRNPAGVFEAIAIEDVVAAARRLEPVHEATGGEDGLVSIEVQPHLARDTAASIAAARRLWKGCARPNILIKIPGTEQGLPAIRQCLTEGINVNITLLFAIERYRQVMDAYLGALEDRLERGLPVDQIRSVASFFVSRVDTHADRKLDRLAQNAEHARKKRQARELRGKLGIANARLAYQAFRETFESPRFAALEARGGRVQRPLWASTSTKDPAYPKLYYVEALIGPRTVDTMPMATLEAYREHGDPRVRLEEDLTGARDTVQGLELLGLDPARITRDLEEEGIQRFSDSYDRLLSSIQRKERVLGLV